MLNLSSLFNISLENSKNKRGMALKNTGLTQFQINLTFDEPIYKLLARESLGLPNQSITDDELSLMVAVPELFFTSLFKLCGGNSSKRSSSIPILLKEYFDCFKTIFVPNTIIQDVKTHKIDKMLICHGLCTLGDSILLLADIGRCCRIANLLNVSTQQVMLADLSWIRHNRSLNSVYSNHDEFIDLLRITTDKRSRLYAALGLDEIRFGISDYNMPFDCISYTGILDLVKRLLNFAEAVWGLECREPHDKLLKKKIGTRLEHISKHQNLDNNQYVKAMVNVHDSVAVGLEETLSHELAILRTISEKFGVFDEDVLLYYLAQYCAQNRFDNYVKIASSTEKKFDQPFEELSSDFFSVLKKVDSKLIDRENEHSSHHCQRHIYFPTYRLGQYEMLSYYALSKDVMKKNAADSICGTTILLNITGENALNTIQKVLKETPIANRNQLFSDLLSFLCLLSQYYGLSDSLVSAIKGFFTDEYIDCVDMILNYSKLVENTINIHRLYVNYIEREGSMIPVHFFPYLLEESDWNEERFESAANIIVATLDIVKKICE